MLQFKPQQPVSPEPPENRWSIGIDRRHVAVYVAIALVIGFVIGFISARYNQKKEPGQLNAERASIPEPRAGALPDNATSEFHRVSRIVRADTVEVDGVGVVKLLGIETPDGKSPKDIYATHGQNALNFAQKSLLNQDVRLEFDSTNGARGNKDDQGQILAYLYTKEGTLVNGEMVRLGLAFVKGTEQFRKSDQFRALEREAVQAMRGVWGSSGSSSTVASSTPAIPSAIEPPKAAADERRKLSPLPPSALGPNVPALSSPGFSSTTSSSEPSVLVSGNDRMYHKSGCEFLDKKTRSLSLSQARSEGYTACSRCYVSTAMKAP
jgi:micrococcal nuclease